MRKPLVVFLASALTLTACGTIRDSNLNPFNWFGGSRPAKLEQAPANSNPLIPVERRGLLRRKEVAYAGTPVASITALAIERVAGGAIIRVTGVSNSLTAFEVRLVAENEGEPVKGTLTYVLHALQPRPAPAGTPASSREVTAAQYISDEDLAQVRAIRVEGATNARVSRRR